VFMKADKSGTMSYRSWVNGQKKMI